MKRTALLLVAIFLGTASQLSSAPGKEIPFETVLQGTHSGISDPMHKLIRSEKEWKELWAKHTRGSTPVPPAPKIDFSKKDLIMVVAGTRSNSGYGLTIEKVEEGEKKLIIHVKESKPAPDAITLQVLTQPFHFVTIPKSNKQELDLQKN
jgi:hypothetical protein